MESSCQPIVRIQLNALSCVVARRKALGPPLAVFLGNIRDELFGVSTRIDLLINTPATN